MIKNEPKKYVGDYNVDAVRDAYENRSGSLQGGIIFS